MSNIHDYYRLLGRHFRRRRMRQFARQFEIDDQTRVIDLGGTHFNWSLLEHRPVVTIVNLKDAHGLEATGDPKLRVVFYDGNRVPFPNKNFEICYSNSVIEHVGDDQAVSHFVDEIKRVAEKYYVQTPNHFFPIEPHFICLFIHWLPYRLKRRLLRYFSVWGLVTKPNQDTIDRTLRDIRFLTGKQLKQLFPEAEIVKERVFGLTKSFIVMKR